MFHNDILGFIFYPLIVFIGATTSYEDFKTFKIRNKWILIGLIYTVSVYLSFSILYGLAVKQILSPAIGKFSFCFVWNFDKWCINLAISTLVAYLLWHFKMWGAGDAKLFITYAALIPMGQYHRVYFNYYFASFLLLLSIFIPVTIYIFLKAVLYFAKRMDIREIKEKIRQLTKKHIDSIRIIETLKILLGFFCFFLLSRIFGQEFNNLVSRFLTNQYILTLISLIAFRYFSKFFKKESKFIILTFIILIIYFLVKIHDTGARYLVLMGSSLIKSISIMVLFPIINKIINIYEENTAHKTIPFAIWMFIGVLITWFI
ncbi:MAG: prepilin peptidase [Candidatus Omnitrophica bacterium]|nr:prepilin peptidase [Candidatus Omnitrophota bacterium]MDD5352608.1 prepilin peptidase [Candidatus Omnitrophota bacterium]MDD5550206.1 prepilin peptidase [Candidatus Omnitrophota bacterium]